MMNRPSRSGQRKRRVRFSSDWLAPMILAAFAVLLVALAVLDILDNRRFVARAESANGVVIDVVEYGGDYYPVVRFSTPDERGVADERSVQFEAAQGAGDRSHFRVGDSVGVLYDRENPEDARLDTLSGRWGDGAPLLLPGLIILLACVAMAIQSRLGRRWLTPSGSYWRERFYAVPPEQTFSALKTLVSSKFAVQESVDSTMRISFDKGWSFWSLGENVSVRVVPDEGGAVVRVEAASKISGHLGEVGRLRKLVDGLFTDLANVLGSELTGGS